MKFPTGNLSARAIYKLEVDVPQNRDLPGENTGQFKKEGNTFTCL
jgi:hypothetical protein